MVKDLRAARQRVKSFLLRHGRVFKGTFHIGAGGIKPQYGSCPIIDATCR